MATSIKGPWSQAKIDQFLQTSVYPLRLACVAPDGFPRVVSVWFYYQAGQFHCVSHRSSKLVRLLRDNNRVGFEVSPNQPPYCGVRGQGVAQLASEGAGSTLELLLDRYLGGADSGLGHWLLSRADEELMITIDPLRIFSWDYRERMSNAIAPDGAD